MRRTLCAVILLVFAILSGSRPALAQAPTLAGSMDAKKIVVDEKNREQAVSAEKVYPKDRIEYTLSYRNVGEAPASGVNLVGPIPAGTIYIDRTASDRKGARPLFSIDGGKTYHRAPITYTVINAKGEKEERVATSDMYTHIQWSVEGVLDVGHEVSVSYRVEVR